MGDKEALRDLLVSRGLASEEEATDFVQATAPTDAKRLIDLIMSGLGGPTSNLSDGEGGFLAGLRKILDSRRSDAELTLPPKPYTVPRAEKEAAKAAFADEVISSNEKFVDGLKLILENKRKEQIGSLAVWQGELDDEDFARAASETESELQKSNEALLNAVKDELDGQARATKELIERHRDAADEQSEA